VKRSNNVGGYDEVDASEELDRDVEIAEGETRKRPLRHVNEVLEERRLREMGKEVWE
jgi:hypothetical protein